MGEFHESKEKKICIICRMIAPKTQNVTQEYQVSRRYFLFDSPGDSFSWQSGQWRIGLRPKINISPLTTSTTKKTFGFGCDLS